MFYFSSFSLGQKDSPQILESKSCSVVSNCLHPMDYTVYGILQTRILEWVAFPFSRGSPQPRDQTQIIHIAGRFFNSWATIEAQISAMTSLAGPAASHLGNQVTNIFEDFSQVQKFVPYI